MPVRWTGVGFWAGASAGAVALAGRTNQRRTLETLDTTQTVEPGSLHHEALDVVASSDQVTLRYEMAADGQFDVLPFGGQSDPAKYDVYRRLVAGEPDARPEPSEWHTVLGAEDTASVNRPLRTGRHHLVVDNTQFGEADPDGTLRPTVDRSVRDFEPFP